MKSLLAVLAIPFSLAGSLAIILEVYSRTARAQLATSELLKSLSQLSVTIPHLILYLGLLSLMTAIAYAIISFAISASHRVRTQTRVIAATNLMRLANRDTLVAKHLLNNGHQVIDISQVHTERER